MTWHEPLTPLLPTPHPPPWKNLMNQLAERASLLVGTILVAKC